MNRYFASSVSIAALTLAAAAVGQQAPATCQAQGFSLPAYRSVEVLPDGRVTFRLCAPQATEARVTSPDIPDVIPSALVHCCFARRLR
jgi:enterochelin esterase family protein